MDKYEIVEDYPPNYREIQRVFKLRKKDKIVFTYGKKIYNPRGVKMEGHLIAHELTHTKQQGDDPAYWWQRYLNEPEFRKIEELEAYREQYKWFCKNYKDRNQRAMFLYMIAHDFSSWVYGNIIEPEEARKLIKDETST